MKGSRYRWLLWCCAAVCSAHHSTASYDMDAPVTVAGIVHEFEWSNPHVLLKLGVSSPKGITEWTVELTSPRHLRDRGFSKNSFKPGDEAECTGGPSRDGDSRLHADSSCRLLKKRAKR